MRGEGEEQHFHGSALCDRVTLTERGPWCVESMEAIILTLFNRLKRTQCIS